MCLYHHLQIVHEELSNGSMWPGYKFVGDNINKMLNHDTNTMKLRDNLFHGIAVQDMVDFTAVLESPPPQSIPEICVFVPSQTDVNTIKEELSILIAWYE